MSDVSLEERAAMATDPALRMKVAAALVSQAAQVTSTGRPGGDASRGDMASWGFAMTVMAPTDEQVSRAQWLIAALPDGPAGAHAAGGAVTDAALQDALLRVWASLAGA